MSGWIGAIRAFVRARLKSRFFSQLRVDRNALSARRRLAQWVDRQAALSGFSVQTAFVWKLK